MPVSISHLRRWFAGAAILVCVIIAGTYFYARHRVQNALKQVPGRIGIEIQQSAQGFTISKSDQGRTLFKLQASKAVQFKQGGHAELHDVTITLYGRDSSRFDQVYGKEFDYDQQSGNVTSKGEVAIDLEANPQGILNPDQATPKELKNPIHLRTTDLVFNKNTGDAWTAAAVEFSVPQASGSALGAKYAASQSVLTLQSQVKIVVNGAPPSTILARQATIEKIPRQIVLREPRAESPGQNAQADELVLSLFEDNTLDQAVARGHVLLVDAGRKAASAITRASADKLDVFMKPKKGIQTAVLSGDVRIKSEGAQTAEASAGRAVLTFAAHNSLSKIHAEQQVRLVQHQHSAASGRESLAASNSSSSGEHGGAQDTEITAPAMDLFVVEGRRLTRADTVGPPQIELRPAGNTPGQKTLVTADKFTARFNSLGQLASVHGEAHARVVTRGPTNDPDRISTSDAIDASFRPGTGIDALVQQGHFTYTSGTQQAFADRARYTPADQILTLSGQPRIVDAGMSTTGRSVRLNRATGEGFADGDVKTTYSDMKAQPDGALLASSDPVHVTAQSMAARGNPATVTYTGNARLWQNANVIEAPSIQFQKNERNVVAASRGDKKVSTVLIATDKGGKSMPVTVTANRLTYLDSERRVHFEGGVTMHGSDMTITSNRMDVFLQKPVVDSANPRNRPEAPAPKPTVGAPSVPQTEISSTKLEKIVASGSVLITEPNRRATGEQLTYTAVDDRFVLTGGPPSIFDAEHGKITGVSLTLFRRDGRVVVEGDSSSPAVTQTRVVR